MADDTESTGGEPKSLSLEEAAAAFTASQAKEPQGQPDPEDEVEADLETNDAPADEADAEEVDSETDGQAEDEKDAEQESDQGRFVASNGKVKLPDGTVSTVADLIQGNLRDRDYRQKTMEAAEVRKAAEAQSAAIKASEQQLNERFQYVERLLQSMAPQPPDETLAQTSPFEWTVQHANYVQAAKAYQAHLDYIQGELSKASTTAKSKAEADQKAKVEREEAALYEKLPALRDPAKLTAFANDIKTFGQQTYGFSPQEIAQVAMDHRQAIVMRDAIAWRKLQASKPGVTKKVEGRPAIQRGGKRQTPQEQRARTASDAMNRLKESGSEADAVAAYLATRSR
jgi:hypothetical protein